MSDMIKDEFGGWMFTEDDRTALADILKAKFDSKQIDNFIVLLQWICFQMKIWQDLPSGPKIKKKADPLLKSLKKTINHLLWLEKGQLANKIALKKTIVNISRDSMRMALPTLAFLILLVAILTHGTTLDRVVR